MRWINSTFLGLLAPLLLAFVIRRLVTPHALVYCTTTDNRIYTITEAPDGIPETASCFSIYKNLFQEVWKTRDEVPEGRKGSIVEIGGWVLPGLWDGHGHITQFGEMENAVKVYAARSIDDVINSVLEYAASHQSHGTNTKWIRGMGWDQAYFGGVMPTAEQLSSDTTLKDLYIMLDRVDVHCVWVSQAVMRLLPTPLPPTPPGGDIPSNGVFCDNAMDLVLPFMPKPTREDLLERVDTAMKELNKVGLVGVMDAAMAQDEGETMNWLASMKISTLRVYGMLECKVRNSYCADDPDVEQIIREDGMFTLRAVKIFADGALGSWGAALISPYTDKPSLTGSMLINQTALSMVAQQWYDAGWQVNIHAIGDRANRAALDAFEAAIGLNITNGHDRRLRIEHAQIIHPEDQPRLEKLGIIPSIQPAHATSDMNYAEDRLGKERLATSAYRMKSLYDFSAPVLGSDFPVEPPNPFHGMYAATKRLSPATGTSPSGDGGWYPMEKLSRQQALRGFTVNVALGGFMEGKGVGRIVEGGWADWVVIGGDILDEKFDLREAVVGETWVGGKRVYKKLE